jgi:hypothetical protein
MLFMTKNKYMAFPLSLAIELFDMSAHIRGISFFRWVTMSDSSMLLIKLIKERERESPRRGNGIYVKLTCNGAA